MKQQMNAVKNSPKRWMHALPRGQRGAATILTVLLIGVGLVSVSMGAMHMVRSTQERQLAAHAQVNSQAGVWATVETVRVYLQTLDKDQLTTLAPNQTWTITGNDNLTQQAILVEVIPPVDPKIDYKVRAKLTATDISARSSSSVEVIYSVEPSSDGDMQLSGVLDFYNDLKTTGGITLTAPDGVGLNFNVDGDFSATSAGIHGTGFGNINVTGNILLDSQVAANVIRGRNITLTQAASVKRAEAWGIPKGETGSVGEASDKGKGYTCCGNITIGSWPAIAGMPVAVTAHANGNVDSAAGEVKTIMARKDVKLAGNGSDSVSALGNVHITNWTAKATNVIAGGNLTVSGGVGGSGVTMAAVGIADCPEGNTRGHSIKARLAENLQPNCKGTVDASLAPPLITKVPEVKLIPPVVDSWALKAAANYAIEFTDDKKVRVTVKNVNGIADGDNYYLGHYGKAQMHLCKAVTVTPEGYSTCNTTGTDALAKNASMPFCINHDEDTVCITPDFDKKTLVIKADSTPASMPAGVIWFNGSLNLMGGPFFNTFIATDDITTGGAVNIYSVNYGSDYLINGSSDAVCKNQRGASIFAAYTSKYPTNFCSSTLEFVPQAIGNIALVAGGYNPATPDTFTGGNVTLTALSNIYGTLVAGNILKTSGSATIYGYISAAGLNQDPTEINTLTAALNVDLTKKPAAYTPDKIPGTDGGGASSSVSTATVLWSRYL